MNARTTSGPATIVISPGLYSLNRCVVFASDRAFTEHDRLTIRASVLPDDLQWRADLMPVIVSAENLGRSGAPGRVSETYSFKIQTSHATVQGLKFLGNPLLHNWHCCIERLGEKLDDLLVTQCVFAGNARTPDIYCAALATGDRFIVDHCTFSGCHACTVFWDGPEGIGGNGCAMRYCLVRDARISAVWTCQTAKDFEFHHNVVTDSEYLWMRKPGDQQTYRMRDCVLIDNEHLSGYGTAAGPSGQTGPEVSFDRSNVVTEGRIAFTSTPPLRLVENSVGRGLGAGLFKSQ
ncbi:MAG: hypothetical protein JW993_16795 [Sedimentisphaerales bacterium]|nr:hypothetical protein [Sedimentisphaerales bacterium]